MKERIKILLTEEEVDRRIEQLGEQITQDYQGKKPHLICVLKGGAPFMCELSKRIKLPLTMDFMSVGSYEGTESFVRKLERITSKKFAEKREDSE